MQGTCSLFVARRGSSLWRSHIVGRRWRSTLSPLRISEEVQQALAERRPVVALESAVYTHGFPYPDNVALASLLESVIRTTGAVPATIGVLDGVPRVGLDPEELIRLAGSAGQETTIKVSRRDLAFACGLGSPGRRLNGGTTVAGTMALAHMAGIHVFATGGLGGVHRGGETTMDISADLTELGRTPVAVISSGCKSFLDIPRTLEYLETEGVPVATFADGRNGKVDFPGFWSRESGTISPTTVVSEKQAAEIIDAQLRLGLQTGLFFGNPIPQELGIPRLEIEEAIKEAVDEAASVGATGSANTPYILNKIKELTGRRSVESNRGLLASNAKRGALVAIELAAFQRESPLKVHEQSADSINVSGASDRTQQGVLRRNPSLAQPKHLVKIDHEQRIKSGPDSAKHASVFVAGSVAVDLSCDYAPGSKAQSTAPRLHTSNPVSIVQTFGGVGHNVARAAHLLGTSVRLCSMVGHDPAGQAAISALTDVGMDTTGVVQMQDQRTSQYVAVNDANKDLFVAMADMHIMEIDFNLLESTWKPQLARDKPKLVVVDANWTSEQYLRWLSVAKAGGARTIFEPVSTIKGTGLFQASNTTALATYPNNIVDIAAPNTYELQAMHAAAKAQGFFDSEAWWQVIDSLGISSAGASMQLAMATSPDMVDAGIPQQSIQLLPFVPCILTKLGANGVLLTQLLPAGDARLRDGRYSKHVISTCANGSEDINKVGGMYMRLFPPVEMVPPEEIISVNGVGDTFLGALVASLVQDHGVNVEDVVDFAQRAAVMTLRSHESVSPELSTLLKVQNPGSR